MNNFIKIWLAAVISLCYCYGVGKIIPKGIWRLLCFLPVFGLFIFLPLNLSSIHLTALTAFFISWLCNFKLLLFAFNRGPLSPPSLSLLHFLAISCLPIKIQTKTPSSNEIKSKKSLVNYAIKIVLFAVLVRVYDYSDQIHPRVLLLLYSLGFYLSLETIMTTVAALARGLLGLELERQFSEPYLSTSLQDFWGRRWNIMASNILRPTIYEPVRDMGSRFVGPKWASFPALFGTFAVSGLVHELLFYYLGRVKPTWEITCFFLLHGACLVAEVAVKKALKDRWRLPRVVATPLTVGFVVVTGFWFFFPQLLRCKADERAIEEYVAIGSFFKKTFSFIFNLFYI